MIRYTFSENFVALKNAKIADAQVLGEALQKIYDQHGDGFTPKHVVDVARKRNHPFHAHFEWDDKKAADAHRLDQARTLIRCIRRVDNEDETEAGPAFMSVSNKGIAYHATESVISSVDMQHAVLRAAHRDLQAFQKRYAQFREICALVSVAEDRLKQMQGEDQHAPA